MSSVPRLYVGKLTASPNVLEDIYSFLLVHRLQIFRMANGTVLLNSTSNIEAFLKPLSNDAVF